MNNGIARAPCALLFLPFFLLPLFYALNSVVVCKKCVTGTVCYFYENQTCTQQKFASIHVTLKVKCRRKRIKLRDDVGLPSS